MSALWHHDYSISANKHGDSVEDFNKAKALAQSAAKSGAYLYPIKVDPHTEVPRFIQLALTSLGNLLLPFSQVVMETPTLQARSNDDTFCRGGSIHVRVCLPPTTRRPRLRQRPTRSLHYHPPHTLRIINNYHTSFSHILDSRCVGGYL